MIDTLTPNCANRAYGTAIIRTTSKSKREIRILITLPYHPSIARLNRRCCGLRGLKGDGLRDEDSTDALPSLCNMAHFSWNVPD